MSLTSETVKRDEEAAGEEEEDEEEEEEEEEEERYCVCRGPYGNKFMIACDGCEEWFHGSCISINSDQAKTVDKYYCPFCREKDPSLKTVFKTKVKDKERDKHREKRHKEKLKRREEKKKREEKRSKHGLNSDSEDQVPVKKVKPELSFKKKSDTRDTLNKEEFKKLKKSKEELRLKSSKEDFKIKPKEREEFKAKQSDESKSRQPQPDVIPKVKPEEPAKFKIPKEAESVKTKTVKIKEEREVRAPAPATSTEEPFKKKEKKKVEVPVKVDEVKDVKKDEEKKEKADEPTPPSKPSKSVQSPKPTKATPPSKHSKPTPPPKPSKPSESDDDADFDVFLNALSKQSKPKAPVVSSSEDEDVDVGMDEVVMDTNKKPTKSVKDQSVRLGKPASAQGRKKVLKKKGRPKKQIGAKNEVVGGQNDKESSEEEEKQCLGPGCCNEARRRSRYCSDDCGVQLAVKRIRTFLPERKEEMKRGGTARRFDEEMISDLEKQQTVAHQKILELQNQRMVIMNLVQNARANILDNNSEEDLSDEEMLGDNEEVDCVICGMACTDKNAVRHMERCYNKFESKLGLGSTVKCHVTWESPVCDAYDRQQGTYCKKLRVLCPDHNKEKEEHDGICGCPLDLSEISENSTVCHKGKRACNKHTGWEKLRLAEIDMERVLQDLKLEDSFEEMRKVKYRMAYRTNLLQILLNGTICHGQESRSSVT